jgi:hypothetical protein
MRENFLLKQKNERFKREIDIQKRSFSRNSAVQKNIFLKKLHNPKNSLIKTNNTNSSLKDFDSSTQTN